MGDEEENTGDYTCGSDVNRLKRTVGVRLLLLGRSSKNWPTSEGTPSRRALLSGKTDRWRDASGGDLTVEVNDTTCKKETHM